MGLRDTLQLMLERGQDSPLLRYSLGLECTKTGDFVSAIDHLRKAVEHNPGYSAAWKALGEAHTSAGSPDKAAEVYELGIAAAQKSGDIQAAKEMSVFLKRLRR